MSDFNSRRFPNFSQYLNDLNTIPSPYDQAVQQQQQGSFNIDAELSLFTNAEFFDFDNFDNFGDLSLPTLDSTEDDSSASTTAKSEEQKPDVKFMELLNGLPRDAFSGWNNVSNNDAQPTQGVQFPAIAPAVGPVNNISLQPPVLPAPSPTQAKIATAPKRKQPLKPSPTSVEEASRIAAEEDKRRRNTAASARFRIKKKQREQALEKTVKDTSARNTALEARVSQLELENQWLKNLITEKNDGGSEGRKTETDIANMFKNFLASHKDAGQSGPGLASGASTARLS